MAKGQRTRTSKTSSGSGIKHRKTTLSELQKVLLGQGAFKTIGQLGQRAGYTGGNNYSGNNKK